MGLPGKDKLHRHAGVGHNAHQPVVIAEDQVGPFVGGKTAGKADGEGVWIKQNTAGDGFHRVHMVAGPFFSPSVDDVSHQLALQVPVDEP